MMDDWWRLANPTLMFIHIGFLLLEFLLNISCFWHLVLRFALDTNRASIYAQKLEHFGSIRHHFQTLLSSLKNKYPFTNAFFNSRILQHIQDTKIQHRVCEFLSKKIGIQFKQIRYTSQNDDVNERYASLEPNSLYTNRKRIVILSG